MGIEQIKKQIKSSEIRPVYIFYGNDEYTKKELEKEVENKINHHYGGSEKIIFKGEEKEPADLMQETQLGSLFSNHKLIIARECDGYIAKKGFKKFLNLQIEKDTDATIVLNISKKKIKGLKSIPCFKVSVPYESKLPGWIKNHLQERNKKISEEAANMIVFYCGKNLLNITKEIEKLLTAYPEKKFYDTNDVNAVIGDYMKDDIFGFIDSLLELNEEKTFKLLENLLKYGTNPLNIVGVMRWKFQQMIKIGMLLEQGIQEKEILKKLNLPVYFYRGICSKVKRFTLKRLFQLYSNLQKLDVEIKTSSTDSSLLIENFIFKIFYC
ncbi:MAG: DNA polymerase III subunit delta [Elusimicrobiota bacterium]